jgi:hypothetical protein
LLPLYLPNTSLRDIEQSAAMVTKIISSRPGQGLKTVLLWDQESTPALSYLQPCLAFAPALSTRASAATHKTSA